MLTAAVGMPGSPVSYTHLDVYKRQVRSLLISEEDLLEAEAAWAARVPFAPMVIVSSEVRDAETAGLRAVELTEDDLFERCLLYTSRCV